MRILVIFLVFVPISHGQPRLYRVCRVPAVCTRSNGQKVANWRPIRNPRNPPTPPPPPVTTQRPPATTECPTASVTDPFQGQSLSDAEKIRRLTARVQALNQPGWFNGNNGYQYWVSRPGSAVPYDSAVRECQGFGAKVATVGMREASSRQYIVENILKRCPNIHAWWIGYRDVKTEGTFEWDDGVSGDDATFPWHQNQPDNSNNADCVVVSRDRNYEWDDVPCQSSNNGVLCERFVGTL